MSKLVKHPSRILIAQRYELIRARTLCGETGDRFRLTTKPEIHGKDSNFGLFVLVAGRQSATRRSFCHRFRVQQNLTQPFKFLFLFWRDLMLRTMKLFTVLAALVLVVATCQTARADLVTYELGPFQVDGFGTSANDSMADAYGNLYDMLVEIENNLPEGHVMLEFVIEDQGWTTFNHYSIDFHVLVWIPTDPGPPGGGL
jgi:hypothetical protein